MTGFSFLRSFFDFCKPFTTSSKYIVPMHAVLMIVICKPFTTIDAPVDMLYPVLMIVICKPFTTR